MVSESEAVVRFLDAVGPRRATELLAPFLAERRRDRIEEVLSRRIASVQIAVEAPSDPHNAAAVLRTADSLGVATAHLVAVEGRALRARSVTQGAHDWVDVEVHAGLEDFLREVRRRGLWTWGASPRGQLTLAEVPRDLPVILLFGNEQRGLSPEAEASCDGTFRIPMVGMSESLNLSVAAAIAMYEVVRARRETLGSLGDLDGDAQDRLRARWYARCVDERLLRGLLADS